MQATRDSCSYLTTGHQHAHSAVMPNIQQAKSSLSQTSAPEERIQSFLVRYQKGLPRDSAMTPAQGSTGSHIQCPGSLARLRTPLGNRRSRRAAPALLGPLAALQVSPTLGLLKSARFHQLWAPRECQVSPTLGPSQAPSFTYFRPLASCRLHLFWAPWQRSRFHLLWASSRVPGFTNFGPLASARFHLLWAPTYFRPFASCRLHLFWAPWKRSRFHLLWASSRVPGFTNFGPLASARFHLLWAPRKLQVSPTLGPSQAAGFTPFGPLGSAPGFTYFGP